MLPEGAIDLHVHCAPDTRPRKMTAHELIAAGRRAGMGGFLLKNHDTPTTATAALLQPACDGMRIVGGLVLNEAVGGFNPAAVETALRFGARQIWMPTHCAANERAHKGLDGGLSVFDDAGAVHQALRDICALIAEQRAILATGHLAEAEIAALIPVARDCGVTRILINHPEIEFQNLSAAFQRALAAPDIRFERCYPRAQFVLDWDGLARITRETGTEHNILATDLGQPDSMDPVSGLGQMANEFAARGFHPNELTQLLRTGPAEWLAA